MTATRFTAAEVARACKGVLAAGLTVARVEIEPVTCKIVVIPGTPATPEPESGAEGNEWDGNDGA